MLALTENTVLFIQVFLCSVANNHSKNKQGQALIDAGSGSLYISGKLVDNADVDQERVHVDL